MPLKIFVSYRRQDTAASAIGIGQYLEKEFGRKNVYIDIDMHAGAKFPAVIEKRLAECKALLVLIGSDWVKSKDEHGHPRLLKPDDWVRLEIAYALKKDISVIPILVNGAQLPHKDELPDDIQGLLDHQAASVTLSGFRHEMAGLVRDIRSIGTPKPWRLWGAIAAALILSVTAGVSVYGLYNLRERSRLPAPLPESPAPPQKSNGGWTNGVWKGRPGEWVMYGIDTAPVAYFINSSSVKSFGDRVAYKARFPLHLNASASSEQNTSQAAYEDDLTVLDCKKSVFALAERTVYNIGGEIIFHFKSGEPESLDLSQWVSPTAMLALAERIVCDEHLRALLPSKAQFDNMHLSYLANTPVGDGFFYGPIKPTSNPDYPIDVLGVVRMNTDHTLADITKGQDVRGLPPSYRSLGGNIQISCADKKLLGTADEYYDKDNYLVYVVPHTPAMTLDAKDGSIFANLLNVACRSSPFNVARNYDGMNYISYGTKGQAEQKISVTVQQNGSDLKVSFRTPDGASGEGTGKLTGNRAEALSLHSTTPSCPGSYDGSLSFADNLASWSYKGEDCGGQMTGHGTANQVTQ